MMLEAVRLQARPAGEAEDPRLTVPLKPTSGATVMVEVAVAPTMTVVLVGLAVTEKSWTV